MSALDRSRHQHTAVALPERQLAIWSAESSYTESGAAAGVPVPSAATQLALTAAGPQSETIDVRIQDGGVPALDATDATFQPLASARCLWRPADETAWYGYDPPMTLSRWQVVSASTGVPEYQRDPDIATNADGQVVIVTDMRNSGSGTQYQLAVRYYTPATQQWTLVIVDQQASPAPTRRPCVVALPSGRFQIYEWVESGTSSSKWLRMWYSDDGGATWSHGGDRINDYAPTASILRTRVAYSDGQLLLGIIVNASGDRSYWQYASSDLGNSFQRVEAGATNATVGLFDVAASLYGGFVVVMAGNNASGNDGVTAHVLADAYAPLSSTTGVGVGTTMDNASGGVDGTAGDLSIVSCEAGILYVFGRIAQQTYAALSYDGGQSWVDHYDEVMTFNLPTSGDYLSNYSATMQRGRILLAHEWEAGTATWASTLGVAYLGGWTRETLPSLNITQTESLLLGWRFVWLPIELPVNAGWSAAGTATEAVTTTGTLTITTTAGNTRTYTRSTSANQDLGFRFVIDPAGSASNERVEAATGVVGVSVRINVAGVDVYDIVAGTQVGSTIPIQMGSPIEVWVEIDHSAEYVQTWYRAPSYAEAHDWIAGPAGALTGGSPTNQIQWGIVTAGAVTNSTWYEFAYADTSSTRLYRALPTAAPTTLRGRPMAGRPYLGASVYLQARGGPAWRGEQWEIPTRATYRLEQAVEVPSPRICWRSASVAQQQIALRWDDAGVTRGLSSVMLLALRDGNVPEVQLHYHNGSTWQSLGTATLAITGLQASRSGRSLTPASGGSRVYLPYGEYAGGTVVLDPGGGSETAHRIDAHSEGVWDASHPLRPTIRILGDVSTAISSGAMSIVPQHAAVLVDLTGLSAQAIRLTIPTSAVGPAEDYWQIGSIHAMWVHPLGHETAWGRMLSTEVRTETLETRDGQRRVVATQPARRSAQIQWESLDQTEIESTQAWPGYVGLGQSVEARASTQGTAYCLDGMYRELRGDRDVMAYLPAVPPLGARLTVMRRPRDVIVGRIEGAIQRTVELGEEHESELVTVGAITIAEDI